MNEDAMQATGRLFAAADFLILVMQNRQGARLLAGQVDEMIKKLGPIAAPFTRAELAEARAFLVRLGFARPADALT